MDELVTIIIERNASIAQLRSNLHKKHKSLLVEE